MDDIQTPEPRPQTVSDSEGVFETFRRELLHAMRPFMVAINANTHIGFYYDHSFILNKIDEFRYGCDLFRLEWLWKKKALETVECLSNHIKNNRVSMTEKFKVMTLHQLANVQMHWARHNVDGCIDDVKSGRLISLQLKYLRNINNTLV